jgi:hypothetical protein
MQSTVYHVAGQMRSRRDRRITILALILAVFSVGQVVRAQEAAGIPSSPFRDIDSALQRSADEGLAESSQIRMSSSARNAVVTTSSVSISLASLNGLPEHNLLERVNRAELRLRALGVDATKIFLEEGVPVELVMIAQVESGFKPGALSRKGALGVWQFMPETARRYGLGVDSKQDERVNLEKETRAAARYLRDLHIRFGDWLLALAAYNAGEDAVQSAVDRSGTADFWTLSNRHLLPQETRNYVPSVLGIVSRPRFGSARNLPAHPVVANTKGLILYAQSDSERPILNSW